MQKRFLTGMLVVLMLSGTAALAQDGPPGFGGPGGPDGQGGPPPFGGGGPMGGPFGGPREITAATVPTDALTKYLKLSTAQQQQIGTIAAKLRSERPRPPRPPQGFDQEGQRPPQPSQAEMTAMRKKMQAADANANKAILAVLTTEQKAKLPLLLKAFSALQADRISLRAAAPLNLSATQVKRLAKAGKSATHEVVVSDFTATQNEIADANRMESRGGFGGPPGGGPPGGGPPDGGPGGPGDGPGGPPPGGPGE